MRLEIRKITMDNFKGVVHKEIVFEGNTKLIGQNGSFKTTTADAFYWAFANTNTALVKEPNVIPIGAEECNPTVEIECLIDGKPLTVKRVQKFRTKEVDGKITSSSTSIYSINDIDKSYRDYVADLTAKGIDMENFLIYSNPNSFLADTSKSGRDKIRKVLFQMAQEFTDLDIAKVVGAIDVAKLIEEKGYTLEEIKASSQASIKKIEAENGRNNELIDAKIAGMLESKVEVNTTELTYKEAAAKAKIAQIEENIKALGMPNNNTEVRIAELEASIKAIELKAKEDYYLKRNEHLKAHSELVDKFREVESIVNLAVKKKTEAQTLVDNDNAILEKLRMDYEKAFSQEFVSDGKCSLCGQPLPEEMVKDAEKKFNDGKAAALKDITEQADAINKELERQAIEIADAEENIEKFTPQLETLKAQIEASSKYDLTEPQVSNIPETVALQAEISDLKAKMDNSYVDELNGLNEALGRARAELSEIEGTRKVIENNVSIDSRVAELREKKRNDEIAKADMEKRLYEVTEVEKAKNKSLSDSINSHFNIINFKLFDYLKNGNYTETVEILIDDKPMTSCANGSLVQLAKIDCIDGLQTFFNQHMPVFVEDAALITANTEQRIKLDSQFIQLIAKDGVETLQIERS